MHHEYNPFTVADEKELLYERVVLQAFDFQIRQQLSEYMFTGNINIDVQFVLDRIARNMVLTLRAKILGEKVDTIQYPANWWEAVKERWAPKWFLKKHPVKYRKIDVMAFYPKLAFPKERHFVEFYKYADDRHES